MGDDDTRVREHLEERRQVGLVFRRLEQPVPARIAPLQELEQPLVVGIGRSLVRRVEPAGVARYLEGRREVLRTEAHAEGDAALVRDPGAELVHRLECGRDPARLRDQVVGPRYPRVRAIARRLGRRAGQDELPVGRRHELGVLGQQLEQDGGAGAWQAGDEDRPVDHLVVDLGVGTIRGLDTQASLQKEEQVLPRPEPAVQVELRFRLDRPEQHVEGFVPVIRAEVVEAGVAHRGGDELVRLQRNHAARVPRTRIVEKRRQPLRARRRLPVAGRARWSFAHATAGYCAAVRCGSAKPGSGNRGAAPFEGDSPHCGDSPQ